MRVILCRFTEGQMNHLKDIRELTAIPVAVYLRQLVVKDMYGISQGYPNPGYGSRTSTITRTETRTIATRGPQNRGQFELMNELKAKLAERKTKCEMIG